jgi:flagellar motility protein MotE (MotC chaperone)
MMATLRSPSTSRFAFVALAALFFCPISLPSFAGPAETARPAASGDEIERFCTNIADPARDRRYALQRQQLVDLQSDIDKRIKLLEEKRAEYEDWLKRRDDFVAKATDGVVEIYSKMKPDGAEAPIEGTDICVVADGRLRQVTGFLDKVPAR